MAAAVEIDAEIQQQLTNEVKLFKRWSFDDVSVISSLPLASLIYYDSRVTLASLSELDITHKDE